MSKIITVINLLHESVKNKTYDFVPTNKNRTTRRKYGLTLFEIEKLFLNITIKDLYKGPIKDRDCPGDYLYVFKKRVLRNVTFYIKLKKDNNHIKIISCHEDERNIYV